MKLVDHLLIIVSSLMLLFLVLYVIKQNDRIKELEIRLDEQQLIDAIGKQMLASRLNIDIR